VSERESLCVSVLLSLCVCVSLARAPRGLVSASLSLSVSVCRFSARSVLRCVREFGVPLIMSSAGAACGPGPNHVGGSGPSNPRKFSEKIALHTQRQAEETAAFQEVMMDLTSTRVTNTHTHTRLRERVSRGKPSNPCFSSHCARAGSSAPANGS